MIDIYSEAVETLKLAASMSRAYYEKPLLVCYSGGKDSDAIVQLCIDSKIDCEFSHNLTTADAPQTVYHVRKTFSELENIGYRCTIKRPYYKGKRVSMWSLIPQKLMPPTRLARYCCEVLKETGGNDRLKAFGVRKDESSARKSRDAFEVIASKKEHAKRWNLSDAQEVYDSAQTMPEIFDCNLITAAKANKSTACNPIINWKARNVIDYLHESKRELNPLYKTYERVGCILCPMGTLRNKQCEARDFPKFRAAYVRAFEKMLEVRQARGLQTQWKSGEEVMHWWLEDGVLPGQMEFKL